MPDLTRFIFQAQGRGFTLPQLDGTTVFLALLSLCAIAAIWGIYQLISVMGGGDDNPIERRLGELHRLVDDGAIRHLGLVSELVGPEQQDAALDRGQASDLAVECIPVRHPYAAHLVRRVPSRAHLTSL